MRGVSHVPDSDVYVGTPSRVQDMPGQLDEKKHSIELVVRRMTANIRVNLNRHAKEWYETMLKNAKNRHRQHAQTVENCSVLNRKMAKGFGNCDKQAMPAAGETNRAKIG